MCSPSWLGVRGVLTGSTHVCHNSPAAALSVWRQKARTRVGPQHCIPLGKTSTVSVTSLQPSRLQLLSSLCVRLQHVTYPAARLCHDVRLGLPQERYCNVERRNALCPSRCERGSPCCCGRGQNSTPPLPCNKRGVPTATCDRDAGVTNDQRRE
jgi:hypothetical protein